MFRLFSKAYFIKKYQFTTKLSVNSEPIEMVNQTKLLGTYLTHDLKWGKKHIRNCEKCLAENAAAL